MRGLVFEVRNKNDPGEENIPGNDSKMLWKTRQKNGSRMVSAFKRVKNCSRRPQLRNVNEFNILAMTYSMMFILLFPMDFVQNVMLPKMNKDLEGQPITYGKFLCFLGLWFFVATCSGFSIMFFSIIEIKFCAGAPYQLNCWILFNMFNQILDVLQYTNYKKPTFKDWFWEV